MVAAPAVAADITGTLLPCTVFVVHWVTHVARCAKGTSPSTVVRVAAIEDRLVAAVPVIVFKHSDCVRRTIGEIKQHSFCKFE